MHPFAGSHGSRGVDDEYHQVGFASLADGPTQVGGPQEEPAAAAAASGLVRCGSTHGLNEMDAGTGARL
jgi:hypothetical protein